MTFSFGSTAPTTNIGFGSATTSAPTFGFGTSNATSAGTSSIGFGTGTSLQPASAPPFGFGVSTNSTTATFGTGSAFNVSKPLAFSGFSNPSITASGGFKPAAPLTGSTLFPSLTQNKTIGLSVSGFGAQAQNQPQQGDAIEALCNAVLYCNIFGDERDSIIAKWNMMQACWGSPGKAFYSNQHPSLQLSPENPLCRFKAISYSYIPTSKNDDGLISLIFNKKLSEIETGKQQLIVSLNQVLGNNPSIKTFIHKVKALKENLTEVVIYIQESMQNGSIKKVLSSDLHLFLSQPNSTNLLKNLGVETVLPKVEFTSDQIKEYLSVPPQGIDPLLWKQAQADNPNREKLIPVLVIGFRSLNERLKLEEEQTKCHEGRLDSIASEISQLQHRHQETVAKMNEAKRKQLELSHRLLQILVKQEITRKMGYTLQPEEEKLRIQLETIQAELAAPTQFKGRLNELVSQTRLHSQARSMLTNEKYLMDPFIQQDIKNILHEQQEGIENLINVIKDDMNDIKIIEESLLQKKH